jgi:hypothetical protein
MYIQCACCQGSSDNVECEHVSTARNWCGLVEPELHMHQYTRDLEIC